MTPTALNPKVVVLIDPNDNVESVTAVSTNVAPIADLTVEVVHSKEEFDQASLGMQFNSEGI